MNSILSPILQKVFANCVLDVNGCLINQNSPKSNGYCYTHTGGKYTPTHRLVWEQLHGPTDLYVLHKCDVKRCCNPDHLFIGTHSDNMLDMYSKERHSQIGEGNANAKLSTEVVEFIRSNHSSHLSSYDLARDLGVSAGYIRSLRCGSLKRWQHA